MVHRPSHWVLVVVVLLGALFVWREVHGQMSTGSQAVFEGRPALAGAQGGLGAQAGPPQGGIGVQGTDGAQIALRRPSGFDATRDMPQGDLREPPVVRGGVEIETARAREWNSPRTVAALD